MAAVAWSWMFWPTDVDPAHEPLERRQLPDPLVDAGIDRCKPRRRDAAGKLATHLGDELRVVLAPVPPALFDPDAREQEAAEGVGHGLIGEVRRLQPVDRNDGPIRRAADAGELRPRMVRVADGEDAALFGRRDRLHGRVERARHAASLVQDGKHIARMNALKGVLVPIGGLAAVGDELLPLTHRHVPLRLIKAAGEAAGAVCPGDLPPEDGAHLR